LGGLQTARPSAISRLSIFRGGRKAGFEERGRSSVVEHNLAKVGVESSNLFARSMKIECPNAALRGGVLLSGDQLLK
jgi:hypothetical protein